MSGELSWVNPAGVPVPGPSQHGNRRTRRGSSRAWAAAPVGPTGLADVAGCAHRAADRSREPLGGAAATGLVVFHLRTWSPLDHPALPGAAVSRYSVHSRPHQTARVSQE